MDFTREDFKLGEFLIQPSLNRIRGRGRIHHVEPKLMAVLICLARSSGSVVARDAILQDVWRGTHVTDSVLNRAVAELRRIFDDQPVSPRFIETIRGRGYRLLPSVRAVHELGNPGGQRREPRWRSVPLRILIAAVLILSSSVALFVGFGPGSGDAALGFDRVIPRTSFVGIEIAPALSSDGARLAYARQSEEGEWRIYWSEEGEAPVALNDQPGKQSGPAWSPHGDWLAYNHELDGKCALFVFHFPSAQLRKMVDQTCHGEFHSRPAWSADGRSIFFTDRFREGSTAIFSLRLEGQRRERLSEPDPSFRDTDPSLSPDGRRLALSRRDALGMSEIYLIDLVSGAETQFTRDGAFVAGHAWEGDDRLLAASTRGNGFALWRFSIRGPEPELLLVPGWKLHRPTIARNAAKMAYETWFYEANIWRIGLTEGTTASLISSTFFDRFPNYSPDGREILFVSNRSGKHEIWRADRHGGSATRLTDVGLPFESAPRWSPDGRYAVFSSHHDGQPDLYCLDLEDGALERLTHDVALELAPAWSLDSTSIYFASNRSGEWQIWSMPSEPDGLPRQVTQSGGFGAFDLGDSLLFTKQGQDGLWRLSAEGEAKVLDDLKWYDWRNWAAAPDGIYYARRTPSGPSLVFRAWEAETTQVIVQPRHLSEWGFALSPSRDELLFVPIDREEADIIVLE